MRLELKYILYTMESIKKKKNLLEIIKWRVWSVFSIYNQKHQKQCYISTFLFDFISSSKWWSMHRCKFILRNHIHGKCVVSYPWLRTNLLFSRNQEKNNFFLLWGFFSEQYYFPFPLCAYYTFICNIYTSINPYNSICIILPFNRQEGWMSETLYIIIHPGTALWAVLC